MCLKEVKGSVTRKLAIISKYGKYSIMLMPVGQHMILQKIIYINFHVLMVIADKIIWGFCTIWWLNCRMFRRYVQPQILE
jgi:hypothetical protein